MNRGRHISTQKHHGDEYYNHFCKICGSRLIRKTLKNGKLETPTSFYKRKTCGKDLIEGEWVRSDCLNKLSDGENNPNYKGIMPKCEVCGISISYPDKEERKVGHERRWCRKHHIEEMRRRGLPEHLSLYCFKKGEFPEHLKAYAFKQGSTPWNKGGVYED